MIRQGILAKQKKLRLVRRRNLGKSHVNVRCVQPQRTVLDFCSISVWSPKFPLSSLHGHHAAGRHTVDSMHTLLDSTATNAHRKVRSPAHVQAFSRLSGRQQSTSPQRKIRPIKDHRHPYNTTQLVILVKDLQQETAELCSNLARLQVAEHAYGKDPARLTKALDKAYDAVRDAQKVCHTCLDRAGLQIIEEKGMIFRNLQSVLPDCLFAQKMSKLPLCTRDSWKQMSLSRLIRSLHPQSSSKRQFRTHRRRPETFKLAKSPGLNRQFECGLRHRLRLRSLSSRGHPPAFCRPRLEDLHRPHNYSHRRKSLHRRKTQRRIGIT